MDPKNRQETLVDPLSLILKGEVYVDLNLPRPPPDEVRLRVRDAVRGLTPRERERALETVGNLLTWARAAEQELRGGAAEQGAAQVRAR